MANTVFFLDEGLYSLNYLKQPGEVLILLLLTVIIAIPPFIIKWKVKAANAGLIALGYSPWIMLILVLL